MKKPVRILIVEDKAADADLARHEIQKVCEHCEFQVVEDWESLADALESFQPEIVLFDHSLPGWSGMEALQLILKHAPLTPFIFWGEPCGEEAAVEFMKAGAQDYVLKENSKRLGPAVVQALEEKAKRVALKQAEDQIKEREQHIQILLSNLPGPVYRCHNDADFTMEFISDGIEELSGYRAEEFQQHRRHFGRMIHRDDQERVWTTIQNAVKEDVPFEMTYRIQTRSGEEKWVWERGQGIRDTQGRLQALEGFITDITERKQIEAALENSEKRFRALIENGLDDISLLSADGKLLWESPSAIRNLGYQPNEFVGRNIFSIMHPDDLAPTQATYEEVLREPDGRKYGTFRLQRSDGTWRWMEAIATNMLHEPYVNAIVVNYRDITEQKEAEIAVQQRNDDLALINRLNEAINRGDDLNAVTVLLRNEVQRIFAAEYTNIFLLDPAGQSIRLIEHVLPLEVRQKIERVIGGSLPAIKIPLQKVGLFQRVLQEERGLLTSDPQEIQAWIAGFIEAPSESSLAKGELRQLVPQITQILNIQSTIIVPLLSGGKALGLLNISGSINLNERDLERIENIAGQLTTALQRREIEEVLKEERNLLRTLIDNIPDRIYAMDREGRKTLSNIADWQACRGQGVEDVIGKTDFDLYPPELAAEYWAPTQAVLQSGQPLLNHEERGVDPEGNEVSILTSKIPLRDDEGNVIGLVGIGRDITERKQAEEKLRRSENQYRLALRATKDVIWEWSPASRQVFWSENAEHVFGYSQEEIGPDDEWWDVRLHPHDRERVDTKLDALLESEGTLWQEEYRFLLKDGSYAHISDRAYIERDEDGTAVRMIGAMSDITSRKQAEMESQALLEIMQGLAHTKDLMELLKLVHESIARVIFAENFYVVLYRQDTGLFEEIYSVDQYDPPLPPSRLEGSITAYVFNSGEPLLLTQDSFRALKERGEVELLGTDSASWLGVPLITSGRTIGVMAVQDYENDNRYTEREKVFLASIAAQVALVIERKQAEEALQENEKRFRALIEKSSDAVALIQPDGQISYVTPGVTKVLGYSVSEYVGRNGVEFTHPDDIERVTGQLTDLLERPGESITILSRQLHKDGSWRHVEGSITNLVNEPSVKALVANFHDVTERVLAEEALQAERAKAQEYLDIADVIMLALDQEGRVTLINQKGCHVLGYTYEEIIGKDWIETFLPAATHTELKATLQQLMSGKIETSRYYENTVISKDGEKRLIAWRNTVIRDAQGTIVGTLSSGEDITERKKVEIALQESNTRFRTLFEASPDAIFLIDPAGDWPIIDCNTAACQMNGYFREELIGQPINILNLTPSEVDRREEYLESIRKAGVLHFEEFHRRKDGTVIAVDISTSLIHVGNKEIILGIDRDVTERKRAERELRLEKERFESIAATVPGIICSLRLRPDGSTCMPFASPKIHDVYGLSPEEVRDDASPLFARVHPDDLPIVQAAIQDSVQTMLPWHSEFRYLHAAKGEVWIEGRAVPLRESDGSIIWHGFIYDITERKRAEAAEHEQRVLAEALRDTAEMLNSTLDYGVVLDHILTAAGRVVPHDAGSILLIDGGWARVVRCHGYEKYNANADMMGVRLPIHETTTLRRIVTTRRPEVVYDTHTYPGWLHMDHTEWLRSNVAAPITSQGEVIGFISLDSHQPEFFTPVHAERLGAFANQAALAIHNSRLLQQAQNEIAERKQAEEELRASEERFRQLADNIQEVFWMTEVETEKELYMSPAAENVWGCSVEYLMNTPGAFMESILPEDRPGVQRALETQRSGNRTEIEYRIRRPDGTVCWVWDRAFPIFDEEGQVIRVAGIAADITDRKSAEHELRKLSRAVEQTSSTIIITDATGTIEYVNPKFTDITGYSMEEVIGQKPSILKSGKTAPEEYESLWQTITSGREWRGELLNKKKNGELYWESVSISPIFDDHGQISHFVGVKEDITQRKQNEIEISRHVAELEAVYENGLAVGRLLEPSEIGNKVIETFARYLPWHHVAIRLRKGDSDDLELVAFNLPSLHNDERARTEQHFIARVNKVGQGLSGWVIQTGQPLRTGDVHKYPQYIDTHAGIQSGLYMPLSVGERIIGVISVESHLPDAFTAQDERLLATLANQTAIAFENARLYEAMQKELEERERAENALRVSETHYRALADSITDILFELDQDLRLTHWNKASESLTGIRASEAIGLSIDDVILRSTEERDRIRKIYEEVLKSHEPRTFEAALTLYGEIRFFEVNAYPSMRGVSVVAKDVTERKRSETVTQKRFELMDFATKHSLDELMQKAVDEVCALTGSTIGFFHLIDADQITLKSQIYSTNAQQQFGDLMERGKHLPVDQAGVWAEAVRQRRSLLHNDYESLSEKKGLPEGHVPIVREMVIPIIRGDQIVAVMGLGNKPEDYTADDLDMATRVADYAWDITERKQMELALEAERNQLAQRVEERTADLSRANSNLARALRVKDEFLANMSHELRTPLNAILGLSESLAEQIAGPLNEKQQKYIATISESGHHLLSLINDILDLAKIDAGQITLDINKVDIRSVCQASLRMITQLAQKKHQDVSLDIDENLGWMWADERRLKQMIVNLLGNAVKFTPEQGKLGLEVRGDKEANQISITVWDHGIGINEKDLQRLFQPFVQLDSGLARETTGTGLGLALVAQMARLHGGSVHARSEAGKGSRFSIVLPWEPALAFDPASRMSITGKFTAVKIDQTNQPSILLVEDTKEVVMMLQDYLERDGYKVFTAQDGVDALVQARHVKPDLILMDIQMPRMDGFETTRKLRSDPNLRYTPIIALTALAMPDDRKRCLEAGMDEYISKPVNLKLLSKIIQDCLFKEETRAS